MFNVTHHFSICEAATTAHLNELVIEFEQCDSDTQSWLFNKLTKEIVTQIDWLLRRRDWIAHESIMGAGVMYDWKALNECTAELGFNYIPQLVKSNYISEPQNGFVSIDWIGLAILKTVCQEELHEMGIEYENETVG